MHCDRLDAISKMNSTHINRNRLAEAVEVREQWDKGGDGGRDNLWPLPEKKKKKSNTL